MANDSNMVGVVVENRFEIQGLIGKGGMASVYRAEHRNVDLKVAIKVLNADEHFSQADIERLKREARALNSLFHPNVVKVYSFGFLDSGEPYLVLDLLHGKSLDDIIVSGNLPPLDWTVESFIQICRGLDAAHQSGLIHRDLKPSNVMIVDADEDGAFVKLLDFGIAKSSMPKDNEQKLTRKGEIFGSPLYISPEQISNKELDKRADVYSLGCLMYEALCGQPALMGDTVVITLMKHLQEKPPSMATHTEREIPQELEALVLKCMEKAPDDRFQSVQEIEEALALCLQKLKARI